MRRTYEPNGKTIGIDARNRGSPGGSDRVPSLEDSLDKLYQRVK